MSKYDSIAEFAILASLVREPDWPAGIHAGLFAHPVTRAMFDWINRARTETGMWAPYAVGVTMDRAGVDAGAVDAAIDELNEVAPMFHPDNRRAAMGLLIERHGLRSGHAVAEIALAKHAARCPLSTAEIEALLQQRSQPAQ